MYQWLECSNFTPDFYVPMQFNVFNNFLTFIPPPRISPF